MSPLSIPAVIQLFPEQASTSAAKVDALFVFLLVVSAFFATLIAGSLVFFAIRYRKGTEADRSSPLEGSLKLELLWTGIPFVLAMVMFVWGASVFFHLSRPPDDTMAIHVVGKRWMWKLQHMNGRREINELHVPVGRAVKLNMTSEDVIHSFYIPAFRIKQDVLPQRYSTTWFKATKPGKYHLFCAEYCGTKHSQMGGWIHVMEPADFEDWLGGGASGIPVAQAGESLFRNLGCGTCHSTESKGRGPDLRGLYGSTVRLEGGTTVVVDDAYLRESIANPRAKITAGYQDIMPTFRGLISEEGMMQLIEYIKSIGARPELVEGRPEPAGGPELVERVEGRP
jgi:cytochrome c oxidase subunit 2